MSTKASAQPGRRTPLSLSGAVTKPHPNKGGGNAAIGGGGGNNANGHTTSNTNKQDNKLQQQKNEQQHTVNNSDTKENPNKKQQQQADKKQQQQDNNKKSSDKNQNGVNNNKQQQGNENKQQQQIKEKQQQQQQNGNDNKLTEKDKKDKLEKSDKLEKQQEMPVKEETKVKEDKKQEQEKPDNKKEENKPKEVKEVREDKNEEKVEEQQQQVKKDNKKSKEETQIKNAEQKPKEKLENMEIEEEQQQQQQSQHKSPPVTPKTNSKANKTSTPVNKTQTKANEKTPQKSTPSITAVKTTSVTKREVTTAVDDNEDIEMEPLAMESSPIKSSQSEEVGHVNIAPSATSTPGKLLLPKRNTAVPKSDVQLAMQTGISPERPRVFSQISGRKSIRPISDYTPSKFQSNSQFRESYRRINTELDATNTSMNVTVGSEVPNNLSFSFFGRGRKRDRTNPQNSESAIGELQTDMEISPPKRARIDMHGFLSAVSSPLSLLRNRFSKATLQNSTPVKLQQKLNVDEDEIEVQNVSGVSVHEEISKTDKEPIDTNNSTNDNNDTTLGEKAKENKIKTESATPSGGASESKEFTDVSLNCEKSCGMEQTSEQSDIKITETPLHPVVGDPMAKNKRCIIM